MKKIFTNLIFILSAIIILTTFSQAQTLDYPHSVTNGVDCVNCHYANATDFLDPSWKHNPPANIDDKPFNNFCWSCHDGTTATKVDTHSSLSTGSRFPAWNIECRTCHWPHHLMQYRTYGAESFTETGQSAAVTATSLTMDGAAWTADEFKGFILIPNLNSDNYNYKIAGNTSDTINVSGSMDLNHVSSGDSFAVVYEKLVKSTITTPNSGDMTVKFFSPTGTNSFSDGDTQYDGICEVCHTMTNHFRNDGTGSDQLHVNMGSPAGTKCTACHKHVNGFRGMGGGAHDTHVTSSYGPKITCVNGNLGCHGTNVIPLMADGQPLATTTVCDTCHSADGAQIAKQYWNTGGSSTGTEGSWLYLLGEESYCGSCHDSTPGSINGNTAFDIAGDNTTYGFYVNGHGRTTDKGAYQMLSWQDSAATGNPAANRTCSDCHEFTSLHMGSTDSRLRAGYENDADNSNCRQCHKPGGAAVAEPVWYTNYTDYENSAHGSSKGNVKCTACHDVHGASGNNPAMTKANQESLCYQCHKDPATGGIENDAISGASLSNNIQQAFSTGDSSKHSLGASYRIDTTNYTIECISCHNVHLVTGKYWEADQNKTPVTRISTPSNPQGNLEIWGDSPSEKMNAYGGTYKTPNGETFTGLELPNYTNFCNECHQPMPDPRDEAGAHGQLNFDSDPHGLNSANQPNGYGTCPNWFACGNAEGWDGDDCTAANPDDCWPVMTRGKGDQLWTRPPYKEEERNAGANFALSCTNCHEAHGSSTGALLRSNPNNGTGTTIWNTMCNNCHYYYSDWHAGMSCGNASCHVSDGSDRMAYTGTNSLHRMGSRYGSSGTRTFNPDLVLDYRFENNLKDSGSWQMDGKWMDNIAGSFAPGKSGQAVYLNGGMNVQAGTENNNWSTDEGHHGTWKYTEMKYNTTLEAWVKPIVDQNYHTIFSKHVGFGNGGYELALRKISGILRVSFNMQADNNGTAQGGAAGMRGAYSSVAVPLNEWTHVAATFDKNGPDGNPGDPSAGRIRIYVNGDDVTTSDSAGSLMQPRAGETSIFAYSENSPWNEAICYNGSWCASEFSIGGFYGWQDEFIGYIDEAKVWNVTKPASYFDPIDAAVAPKLVSTTVDTPNTLLVMFSEGVYGPGGGALQPSNFSLTCSGKTIISVQHTAGSAFAILTLSANLTPSDIDVCTLSVTSGSAVDDHSNPTPATPVTLSGSLCPSPAVFQLNETACSATASDEGGFLTGAVGNSCNTLTGDGYLHANGSSANYVDFENSDTCLQATTEMTIETRIKPTGLSSTGNYIRRILARDSGGNYQISVWRNNSAFAGTFSAPSGEASIALWVKPVDANGGNAWKPVLTNYTGAKTGAENNCPIVSDHWYQIKVVWDTNKPGGTLGQKFQPADIYIDDQGVDGNDAGESWAGYINCTDTDQSLKPDVSKFYTGDSISAADGNFVIGANVNNHANNVFYGLIDWITWENSVE